MNDQTRPPVMRDRMGRVYEPAVGPHLRVLLMLIFLTVAFLGATGIYLGAIRVFEVIHQKIFQNTFSLGMTLAHVLVGLGVIIPFLYFGVSHLATAHKRPNKVAVRLGISLFVTSIVVGLSGILLVRLPGFPQIPTETVPYWIVYGLHAVVPVLAVGLYVAHRRAGPAVKWKWGYAWGGSVALFVGGMLAMHAHNPRTFAKGSPEGEAYFEPSRARTDDAKFIEAYALMNDEYCLKCHADIYKSHLHSAHKFSSFNNPAYLFSVRETRQRAGIRASRWCAGCHDPVPFFSGQFDDPKFDDVNDPTAKAGITCAVCHSITHINSRSGNGDFTITKPQHYPYAYSENPVLQWLNNQLIKAKPELHKKTFLKPFHRTEEFCSICHKVGLPQEVNLYKEFLRGQNHPDSYYLSGVSGHGARSFYYPHVAKTKCSECHMPLVPSSDFGARDFDGSGVRKIHNHLFPGGNTGIHALVTHSGSKEAIDTITKFLQSGPDGKSPPLRIDLFGLKHLASDQAGVEALLIDDQPLRPHLPSFKPGQTYLVEVVIRTWNMGHHFTQGTVDSNEVWVDFTAKSGERVIGRSGALDKGDEGTVDENAHFINVLMLDRHGNRIDRRNPQDIFTPLYDHQIPPGAAQVAHYRLQVPADVKHPVELSARVRYRKFDYRYMEIVHGAGKVPKLPIVDLCADKVVLPVAGAAAKVPEQQSPIKPAWQRWNDYGIACFLEGGPDGKSGGELAQAQRCFQRLLTAEFKDAPEAQSHGHLNLARVHLAYGGLDHLEKARQALTKARECQPPAPWWTVAWFNGLVNVQYVNLDEAVAQFEKILDPKNRDPERRFDFTTDWVVMNELGKTLFLRAQQAEGYDAKLRDSYLRRAVEQFERVLPLDPENVLAHEFLAKCYTRLAGAEHAAAGPAENQVGGFPQDLKDEETRLLKAVAKLQESAADDQRAVAAARELALLLTGLEKHPAAVRAAVLARAHADCVRLSATTPHAWVRMALAPPITGLDRLLLWSLADRARVLNDAKAASEQRRAAGEDMVQALARLGSRPPEADVMPALVALGAWPRAGLPVNLALSGLAEKHILQGPLPAPRLLVLHAVRPKVRDLFAQNDDAALKAVAGRVLARMHLVKHGIFKPDDNAADSAVRRYRDRHPAAARASHPIVIYPLQE